LVVNRFAKEGVRLRRHFEERFENPREATSHRFVWDLWHVPGQYTALRTPAYAYFPKKLYDAFHQRLVWWGRRVLGCHDVSPPWMSCYVNGCEQRFHGDLPHGHFAFVYSLTPWSRRTFRGGETLILRDSVLDYWSDFTSHQSIEEHQLIEAVEPVFNRLVVFDPKLPHGVRRVDGSMDPKEGRLVIHGWFVQPRPFVEGPLPVEALGRAIEQLSEVLASKLAGGLLVAGLVSLSFGVSPQGTVSNVRLLSDTTRVPPSMEPERRALLATIRSAIRAFRFPKMRSPSRVTLPLVFEREPSRT
jgi:hypothetical protein